MTSTIFVCDTCRHADGEREKEGVTGGVIFAAHVEAAAAGTALDVRRVSCLMNCRQHCSVAVSAPGKMGYVLGHYEPSAENAATVVDYASKHSEAADGVVPFREWPQGVKGGKFIARIPPLGG